MMSWYQRGLRGLYFGKENSSGGVFNSSPCVPLLR
jgi:hypothetical protein